MNFLIRLASLLIGCFLLADAVLPAKHETATVAGHTIDRSDHWDSRTRTYDTDEHYRLRLAEGSASPCEVNRSSYNQIHDGDIIDIKRSALINTCLYVASNNEVIYSDKYASLGFPILGLLMLGVAFGIISTDFWRSDRRERI